MPKASLTLFSVPQWEPSNQSNLQWSGAKLRLWLRRGRIATPCSPLVLQEWDRAKEHNAWPVISCRSRGLATFSSCQHSLSAASHFSCKLLGPRASLSSSSICKAPNATEAVVRGAKHYTQTIKGRAVPWKQNSHFTWYPEGISNLLTVPDWEETTVICQVPFHQHQVSIR